MAAKRPPRNEKNAHLFIDTTSPTWHQVRVFAEHVIAKSGAVLEDTGADMVDTNAARGDIRTAKALLKLAQPPEVHTNRNVPETYPSGGPE